MELITDLIIIGALLVAAAYVGLEAFYRRRLWRREVIVVLKGEDGTFRGVLWRHTHTHLELRGARYLEGSGSVPIDGAVILARPNIAWIQDPQTEA